MMGIGLSELVILAVILGVIFVPVVAGLVAVGFLIWRKRQPPAT